MNRAISSALRDHPVRVAWCAAQAAVILFGQWATTYGGADYHIGFLLLPIMFVLLFPGILVPGVLSAVGLKVAEWIAGRPIYVTNDAAAMFLTIATWISAAWITDAFWRRVARRVRGAPSVA